jgi:hypothetical protein
MSGEIEDETLPTDELPHQVHVAAVPFNHFDIILYRLDIEVVRSAGRMHRIEESDGGAGLNEADGEIASDEAETACD